VLGDYPTGDDTPDVGSPEATCIEGDTLRNVVTPPPGTVRIAEWMANPAGSDTSLEWVEVWFGAAADLNAVSLGPAVESAEPVVLGEACVPVDAGSWVVFGASPAAAPRVDAELPFSLANTGPRSIVASVGGELLDRVDYDGAVEGVSAQRDEADVVCDAASASTYDGFNVGTPGTANPPCERALREGECFDDGVARAIDAPSRGEASIREWMPNPEAVENRDGEWVEVRFERAVDLNGLMLSDLTGSSTIDSEECVGVAAGAHVVFAREGDPSLNGGIAAASYPLSISLNNRDETIELGVEGSVLDSVSYAHSESGVAQQVDDDGRVCPATQPYGDGDLGTPGSPNPTCP
jgi:hypothetical protein